MSSISFPHSTTWPSPPQTCRVAALPSPCSTRPLQCLPERLIPIQPSIWLIFNRVGNFTSVGHTPGPRQLETQTATWLGFFNPLLHRSPLSLSFSLFHSFYPFSFPFLTLPLFSKGINKLNLIWAFAGRLRNVINACDCRQAGSMLEATAGLGGKQRVVSASGWWERVWRSRDHPILHE